MPAFLPTAEITWVEPKFQLLLRGNGPLRDPLLIVTESIQVVFAVSSVSASLSSFGPSRTTLKAKYADFSS